MKTVRIVSCFLLGFLLASCQKNETGKSELYVIESHELSGDDSYLLPSYYLSAPVIEKGRHGVLAYNYKNNSLDLFSVDSIWKSIPIQVDGPNGIPGEIVSLLPVSSDSTWVYNREAFYLLDGSGNVMYRHASDYPVICDCNYAMNTAVAGWKNGVLSYPVKDGDTYRLVCYNLETGEIDHSYEFLTPECKQKGGFYGYLELPNVNILKDKVIYSYSYESDIYTLDLQTGETEKHAVTSRFAARTLPSLDKSSDPLSWQRLGWEYPHYYMVYPLSDLDIYVRPLLKGVEVSDGKSVDTIVDENQLVLMIMDSDFTLLDEIELPKGTYYNYQGWCALPDAFLLYKDNALGTPHDELIFDLIRIYLPR